MSVPEVAMLLDRDDRAGKVIHTNSQRDTSSLIGDARIKGVAPRRCRTRAAPSARAAAIIRASARGRIDREGGSGSSPGYLRPCGWAPGLGHHAGSAAVCTKLVSSYMRANPDASAPPRGRWRDAGCCLRTKRSTISDDARKTIARPAIRGHAWLIQGKVWRLAVLKKLRADGHVRSTGSMLAQEHARLSPRS